MLKLSNFKFKLEYVSKGKKQFADKGPFTLNAIDVSDDRLKVSIFPKEKIELKRAVFEYDFEFDSLDKIFVNGYQSWTTSREYSVSDKQLGLRNIARPKGIVRAFAATCGDYDFTRYGGKGFFHSFT